MDAVKIFLNGEIKIEYLRKKLQKYLNINVFIRLFKCRVTYWVTDILVKLISYYSFFTLAKKLIKIYIYVRLLLVYMHPMNIFTWTDFGLFILPYLVYLILYKKKLSIKHFLIIIFLRNKFRRSDDRYVCSCSIHIFYFL